MKDPENPFKVETIHYHEELYTEEQLLDAFPYVSFPEQFKKTYGSDRMIEKIRDLPIKEVLQRCGVEIKGGYAVIEGKVSSMHVNVKENYVNRFSEKGGSGSTIDVTIKFKISFIT